ncbi:MAG: FeoC-like transcriptional regulator [Pleurocapsa sp. MO_192.B19]|nr:FeoC-like transcriptional regulator [Pleurocapsa sp. MO_192.B19]
MKLQELQEFVFDFGPVSLAEMKLYLQVDRDTLNPLLDSLIKKGVVQKSLPTEECKTCQKCEPDEIEFYEWSRVFER